MQRIDHRSGFLASSHLRIALLLFTALLVGFLLVTLLLSTSLHGPRSIVLDLLAALVLTAVFTPLFWQFIVKPLHLAALREQTRAKEMSALSASDWEDTFNTITDMITVHDKDFNIIRANKAAQEQLGLSAGLIGRAKCFRHFHGTDNPPVDCPSCKSIVSAQPVASESFEQHLNMFVETRAIPRFDADRNMIGLIHVVRNITKRKRMEASLENQKRFAESLIQNSAVATFVLDPQHRVVLWNKACEELTGIAAHDMIGTDDHWRPFYAQKRPTLADIVIDGSFDSLSSLYGRHTRSTLISNGVHAEGWFLNINKKNRYIVFDAAPIYSSEGDLLVVIETLQDIPERKRIEEDLAQSESKLRTLIEAEHDCVKVLAADGTLLEMNSAGIRMIEADSFEQVAGRSIYPLIVPEYVGSLRALTERVFRGETGSLEFEFVGLKGARRWADTRALPLRNAQNEVVALLGVTRDVTEHKKLESQLRHAQKMEAVGTLTGGIAHDFNNILTSIVGYGDLLRMTMREDVQWEDYLDQLLASAQRAANLTQNLLAFSRKQIMSPKPVDLNTIISRVERLLHRLIGEDIELQTRLADRELTVLADAGQIEQVLMNLAVNARDAMFGGGVLYLSTGVTEIDSVYIASRGYGKAGTYTRVSITDTGEGMNEHTRERVFEPFFTTKDVGKGTGLGLSIVYGIIKQHGGYIDCESESGKGTTFTIYLPLIERRTEEAGQAPNEVLKGGSETILVTEDDMAVRRLAKTMLEEVGYTVLTAADGAEAVEIFRKNAARIDLLLLDVIMPKQNGKQLYDEIRQVRSDVKILFMSGYTADVVNSRGLLEQGMQIITKPFSLKHLSKKVREVLDQA